MGSALRTASPSASSPRSSACTDAANTKARASALRSCAVSTTATAAALSHRPCPEKARYSPSNCRSRAPKPALRRRPNTVRPEDCHDHDARARGARRRRPRRLQPDRRSLALRLAGQSAAFHHRRREAARLPAPLHRVARTGLPARVDPARPQHAAHGRARGAACDQGQSGAEEHPGGGLDHLRRRGRHPPRTRRGLRRLPDQAAFVRRDGRGDAGPLRALAPHARHARERIMNGNTPIRVLIVDDDEDDVYLVRAMFGEIDDMRTTVDWESSFPKALERLSRERHDIYLVDYRIGAGTGIEWLRTARERGLTAPVIMLTGHGSHKIDLEAMQAGAADYLTKNQIDAAQLGRSVRYALDRSRYM